MAWLWKNEGVAPKKGKAGGADRFMGGNGCRVAVKRGSSVGG